MDNTKEQSTSGNIGQLSEASGIIRMESHGGLKTGDTVIVLGRKGTIRFIGKTLFKEGIWIGVELVLPKGKNDGSVKGVRYFNCKADYGIFVGPQLINTNEKKEPINQSVESYLRTRLNPTSINNDKESLSSATSRQGDNAISPSATSSLPSEEDLEVKDFAPLTLKYKEGDSVPYSEVEELIMRVKHLDQVRTKERAYWSTLQKDIEDSKKFKAVYPRIESQFKERRAEIARLAKENELLKTDLEKVKEERDFELGMLEQLQADLDNSQEQIKILEQKLTSINVDSELNVAIQNISDNENMTATVGQEGYPKKAIIELREKDAQIDKAKDIISRLLDNKNDMEYRLRNEIKELEEHLSVVKDGKEEIEDLRKKLSNANDTISFLNESLENLNTAKETFEALSKSNLELRDKVDILTEENEKLETYQSINEERRANERVRFTETLDELDRMKMDFDTLLETVEALNEEIISKDNRIVEYCQYILTLKDDIHELQETLSKEYHESINLRSETDKMLGLNISLQSMVFKSKSKTVEMELKKIEADQASTHLQCIKPYLPDTFYRNETDSLNFFLQLLRLYSKIELCGRHLCSTQTITSIDLLIGGPGKETMPINNNIAINFQFKYNLNQLNLIIKTFIAHVKSCPVSQYLSISRLSQDITNLESSVDELVDEAKQESLSSTKRIIEVDTMIENMTNLCGSYVIPNATHPLVNAYRGFEMLVGISSSQDVFLSKMTLIIRSITNPKELDLFGKIPDDEMTLINADLLRPLNEFLKLYFSFKLAVASIQRFLDEKDIESISFEANIQEQINLHYQSNDKLVKYACNASSEIINFIRETSNNDDNITFDELKQTLIHSSKDSGFENEPEVLFEQEKLLVSSLLTSFKEIFDRLSKGLGLVKVEVISPWESRAQSLKKELMETDVMEKKLNELNDQTKTLALSNRKNSELLSVKELAVEALTHRNKELTEKLDDFIKIRSKLEEANKKEEIYNQEMEKLYTENHKLEIDIGKYKEMVENLKSAAKDDDNKTIVNSEVIDERSLGMIGNTSFSQAITDFALNQKYQNVAHRAQVLADEIKHLKAQFFAPNHDIDYKQADLYVNSEDITTFTKVVTDGQDIVEDLTNLFIDYGIEENPKEALEIQTTLNVDDFISKFIDFKSTVEPYFYPDIQNLPEIY